jgi:replicative DNA helicase
MKSGSKSDVTRGQEAHVIVLDELDYMGEDDMDALLAMLQKTDENQPDKMLVAASTPSGRRANLWDWCHSSRFKDFWFPSYCNPFWSMEQEEYFRDSYSEIGYRHEIEADWGEDADGVYPRRYVDKCFVQDLSESDPSNDLSWDYKLPRVKFNEPGSFTVFGVDWDKYGAGTNIVVLQVFEAGYHDSDLAGKMKLIYREETIREEYTLTKAVDRIIELNDIYNPFHIYVDRGFGEAQVEMLKRHGTQNPYTGLATKVIGVSFAETIEMPDPHTGVKQKKDMKPFMVDTLRQYLEKESIILTGRDEELYLQLISYIVARITPTGRPVFEMSGRNADHCHDALILATLAIKQNYDELMMYKTTNYVRSINSRILDPLIALSGNPTERAAEADIIEDKFDSPTTAPIKIERSNPVRRASRKRGISRRTF